MAWTGMLDFDDFYSKNKYIDTELKNIPGLEELAGKQYRSNYILEERHTDQIDYNFAASVQHEMRNDMRILGGVNLRANRTWYYDEIKDLMGGDYWYDIDKFAERDMSSTLAAQNDLDYYEATGHARIAREGRQVQLQLPCAPVRGQCLGALFVAHRRLLDERGRRAGLLFDVPRGSLAQGALPEQLEGRFEDTRLPDLYGQGQLRLQVLARPLARGQRRRHAAGSQVRHGVRFAPYA